MMLMELKELLAESRALFGLLFAIVAIFIIHKHNQEKEAKR